MSDPVGPTLGDRLRRFGEGETDAPLLSRSDARYLADLVDDDHETRYVSGTIADHIEEFRADS